MVTLVFNIQPVGAGGTIYIRSDGSVDPPAVPIERDGDTYTFIDDIIDERIVVERDNITIDGKGYTMQAHETDFEYSGFRLYDRNNVSISNVFIRGFGSGILMVNSRKCAVSNVTLTDATVAIWLCYSHRNNVTSNIVAYNEISIFLDNSIFNNIVCNAIINNTDGVYVYGGFLYNRIVGNVIAENGVGIRVMWDGFNSIYHNDIIDNECQVSASYANNTWDDGYPSGGNYWSDYAGNDTYSGPYQNETGSDGIGDSPYPIYGDGHQDRYPLMTPFNRYVAVVDLAPFKTFVGAGYPEYVNVTVTNQGGYAENFNVIVYANTTTIGVQTASLMSGASTTLTFEWKTTALDKGIYTLSASARIVPDEIDAVDSLRIDGVVKVTIPGDVDGDQDVDIYDIVKICVAYGSKKGDSEYVPNRDINCDGEIDVYDVVIACAHYGQSDP